MNPYILKAELLITRTLLLRVPKRGLMFLSVPFISSELLPSRQTVTRNSQRLCKTWRVPAKSCTVDSSWMLTGTGSHHSGLRNLHHKLLNDFGNPCSNH